LGKEYNFEEAGIWFQMATELGHIDTMFLCRFLCFIQQSSVIVLRISYNKSESFSLSFIAIKVYENIVFQFNLTVCCYVTDILLRKSTSNDEKIIIEIRKG
jgi:hypothetical protein